MPTLSSLLLQREVTTLREMDVALARQMSMGGDLPTNLMETAVVEEGALIDAVAESSQLPALAPGPLPAPAASVLKAVPADVASRLGAMPLAIEGESLVLAVSEPLAAAAEEELSFALARGIVQKLTTRVRVCEALNRHYGIALDRRMSRLLARVEGRPDPSPSEAPPARKPGDSMLPPNLPRDQRPVSVAPIIAVGGDPEPIREPSAIPPPARLPSAFDLSPQPSAGYERQSQPSTAAEQVLYMPAQAVARRAAVAGRRRGPFTAAMAQEALSEAEGHGAILRILFDFAKQYFEYTALFVIHGDLAEGVDAAGPGAGANRIRGIGVPMEIPSILAAARDRRSPVLARPTEDGIDAYLRQDLQRPMTVPVVVLPVAVRSRVVALLYGDDGDTPVQMSDVGDVLALVSLVSTALERLLIKRKRLREAGREGTPAPAAVQGPRDELSMVRMPWGRGTGLPPRTIREPLARPASLPLSLLQREPAQRPVAAPFPQPEEGTLPGMATRHVTATYDLLQSARPGAARRESLPEIPQQQSHAQQAPLAETREAVISPYAESVRGYPLVAEQHEPLPLTRTRKTEPPVAREPGSVFVARVISVGADPATLVARKSEPAPVDEDAEQPMPLVQRTSTMPPRDAELSPPPATAPLPAMLPSLPTDTGPNTTPYPILEIVRDPMSAVPQTLKAGSGRMGSMPEIVLEESDPAEAYDAPMDAYEAPEVSVDEGESDEMLEHVLTELERSDGSAGVADEQEPTEDPTSLSPISEGPRAPPKSQHPTDAGLPRVIVDMAGEAEELLNRLIGASDGRRATEARGELVRMGAAAAHTVAKRFPGPLHAGISLDMADLPPASECGPVLDVAVALGQAPLLRQAMVQELVGLTESGERHTRLWALLALADIGTTEVVDPALRALMDSDPVVRRGSSRVIASMGGQVRVGEAMRKSIEQIAASDLTETEVRLLAIETLGAMRDGAAVPVLIDAVQHPDSAISRTANRALRALTRMDAESGAQWIDWWQRNRERPRMEWLIDALTSPSLDMREAAAKELAEHTGRDFGYEAEMPVEARASVQSRYRAWRVQDGRDREL